MQVPILERKFRCVSVGRHVHLLVKDADEEDPTPCHHFERIPDTAEVFQASILEVDCTGCLSWLFSNAS